MISSAGICLGLVFLGFCLGAALVFWVMDVRRRAGGLTPGEANRFEQGRSDAMMGKAKCAMLHDDGFYRCGRYQGAIDANRELSRFNSTADESRRMLS